MEKTKKKSRPKIWQPFVARSGKSFIVTDLATMGLYPATAARLAPVLKKHGLGIERTRRPRRCYVFRTNNQARRIEFDCPVNFDLQEAAALAYKLQQTQGADKRAYLKKIGL